jgi:hypothetical protein
MQNGPQLGSILSLKKIRELAQLWRPVSFEI